MMRGIRFPRRLMLAGLLLVLLASPGSGERIEAPEAVAVAMVERAPVRVEQPSEALTQSAAARIDLSRLQRAKSRRSSLELFAPRSFYTAPPRATSPPPRSPAPVVAAKPAARPAPPPPTAPPLPFKYMGMVRDDPGQPTFFLVKGDELYNVRVGEVIDGMYRIDSIAGSSLRLVYLPLDIAQILPMGDS
jgi:hypothetical protein